MTTTASTQLSLFDLVNRSHSDGTIAMSNISLDAIPAGLRSQKSPAKTPFPLLLHNMLSQVEQDGLSHIFSWMPNGKAIKIHDKKAFIQTIIPRYFPHQTQFKSYLKQLGLYRFVRIGRKDPLGSMNDDYVGAYHHPDFVRYDLARCLEIKRMKVHSSGSSKKAAQQRSAQDIVPTPISRQGALHPTTTELSSFRQYHSQQQRSSCEEQFPQFLGLAGGANNTHGNGAPNAGEDGSSFLHPPPVQTTTTTAPRRRVSEYEIDMLTTASTMLHEAATMTREDHSGEELPALSPSDVPPLLDEAFGRPFFHLFLS